MSLIRNHVACFAPIALFAGSLVGCATRDPIAMREVVAPYDKIVPAVNPEAAMANRNFEPSYAIYANTGVVAGSTHAPLVPASDLKDKDRFLVEPAIFLANIAAAPITYAIAPPLSQNDTKAWRAVTVEPSHTAVPPYESVVPVGPGPYLPILRADLRLPPSGGSPTLPNGAFETTSRQPNPLSGKPKASVMPTTQPSTQPE